MNASPWAVIASDQGYLHKTESDLLVVDQEFRSKSERAFSWKNARLIVSQSGELVLNIDSSSAAIEGLLKMRR